MSPHPDDLDRAFRIVDLTDQAMLDVDAARIRSSQIADKLLLGRRVLEWVLRNDVEKTLRLCSKM